MNGRAALNVGEIRNDAVRRLIEFEADRDFLALGFVGRRHDKHAARAIQARGGKRRGQATINQRYRTGDVDGRLFPEQRLAQEQLANLQLVDLDRQGQVGNGEASGLQVRRGVRVGHGCAKHFDALRSEAFDIEPPAQKCRTTPVNHVALKAKPNAFPISDRDQVDGSARRQCTFNALDTNDAVVGGKPVLDELEKPALVLFRVLCVRDSEWKKQEQEGEKVTHQNACPNPT